MSWSATSTCFLNPSRDRDSTTALGSLVQCLTTLAVKKFSLIFNRNLPPEQLAAIASHPIDRISQLMRGTRWEKTWYVCTASPSACFQVFQCTTNRIVLVREGRGNKRHRNGKLHPKLGQITTKYKQGKFQRLFASAFTVLRTSQKVRGLARCQKYLCLA